VVGDEPEYRLGDELGDAPRGGDQAERRHIDAVLHHEQGQDREKGSEPEQHDELDHQDGQQRSPPVEPAPDAGADGEHRASILRNRFEAR
jgi:hypothetical protein